MFCLLDTLLILCVQLEWENAESFHGFYPSSDAFLGFINIVKPLVAAPPNPQLFQAENRSTSCLSSSLTQIIKGKAASGTEETWKKIEQLLGEKIPTYHANGIEKDAAEFLGLIGWKSKEVIYDSGCLMFFFLRLLIVVLGV